jgi:hypothetical protein
MDKTIQKLISFLENNPNSNKEAIAEATGLKGLVLFKKLKEIFPDELLKRFGIFQDEETAHQIAPKGGRYFSKPEQLIKLKDRTVVVCNQFTLANIQPFLKAAKTLGYKIK